MSLPNFLIIGAAKSGTTSLYSWLKQHPQVYMSPIKEPKFFAFEGVDLNSRDSSIHGLNEVITDLETYKELFSEVKNEIAIGEASPVYLVHPKSPELIQKYIPHVKLIAILRHPADRAYSAYLHRCRDGREKNRDFACALNGKHGSFYWNNGLYYKNLKKYFDRFDHSQIKVYLYDSLKSRPDWLVQDLFDFLNLEPNNNINLECYNSAPTEPSKLMSYLRSLKAYKIFPKKTVKSFLPEPLINTLVNSNRKNILDRKLRASLTKKYKDDILNLQNLTQIDLSHWLIEGEDN